MKTELIIEAFKEVARDKNIDREVLTDIIESVFMNMIKKKYGPEVEENFHVTVNMDKGEIEILQEKMIVEKVTDPVTEIDLETAQKEDPDYEIGEEFIEVVNPADFGRRLIISAKQNFTQKIKDAEKELIFDEYKNRIGEIIVGDVHQISRDEIIINLEKTEVVLKKSEQIYNERYKRGDTIRAYIKDVVKTSKGTEVIVSRTDPRFLVRLFELEVPEIYDGIIDIKVVARKPGDRSKIAVESNDKRIDPVGACVGMKGVRIQAIVRELNNEKIDIINFNSEPSIFISRALSPAKPKEVNVDRELKKARVVIPDDQISIAIGRGGQNLWLTSQLTGYEIDAIRESEVEEKEEDQIDLTLVEGLSKSIVEKLVSEGYETAEEVLDAGIEKLNEISGIGQKTAQKIIDVLNTYYE